MKVVLLYRPDSEHSRRVEEYVHDFRTSRGRDIDLVSLNTREGAATASLYDLLHNPTMLVLRDDGQLVKEWQGTNLPLKSEVAGYLS